MEAYRVFISSIMNPSIEDLAAERQVARTAVERFAPMTVAWAFEAAPASSKPLLDFYLDAVKTCDAFLLIVGQHVTPPVREEAQVALDYRKPMLVFCKEAVVRAPKTQELLRMLDVKYDPFTNPVELQEKVRVSLGHHLLGLIRGEPVLTDQLGFRLARLRAFARERKTVSIVPTVPGCQYNSFMVEEVNATHVRFQKNGIANVDIPAGRIEDVLEAGTHEQPVVHLAGRLQWITARQNWYFRPERPPSPDPLNIGLGRQVPREPAFSPQTLSLLQGNPLQFAWSNPENVSGREVFFDEDGKHLTNGRQILTCTRAIPG
jgi:hypothetical protein